MDNLYRVLSKTGHVMDRFTDEAKAIERMHDWPAANRVTYNGKVIATKENKGVTTKV